MTNYPLASTTWDDAEYQAMQEVIASGMFTMSENVAQFERDFASYLNSNYCVMVNSGSSANLLMVAALFYRESGALKRGDEVIVPAVSWSTTYYPLYQYGLKLRFVDINADTLNYDLASLSEAVNEKTRLIMAVNLLGNPNDFEKIGEQINFWSSSPQFTLYGRYRYLSNIDNELIMNYATKDFGMSIRCLKE
jgi:CDP-6-deoxy-D-xylo-4-hexulose-3-dehydrase